MRRAELDPALGVRVIGVRELRYQTASDPRDDRPPHVRAASGLAFVGGRLAVIQDDVAFIAFVAARRGMPGGEVSALALPRGAGGRRRFEVALGNKAEKLDLEACVAVGDELWAFGSGSTPARERVAIVGDEAHLRDAAPLYRAVREELGSAINVEGAAAVGDELWLFHRGNTGPGDCGPAVVRFARAPFARWLADAGPLPEPTRSERYDLGGLGFTDAVTVGERVYYLAAAEAAPNAIDDGPVTGSQLGVIAGTVRAAPVAVDGTPIKAEGIAFDARDPRHAWIAVDPDNVDQPARLYEIELVGPW